LGICDRKMCLKIVLHPVIYLPGSTLNEESLRCYTRNGQILLKNEISKPDRCYAGVIHTGLGKSPTTPAWFFLWVKMEDLFKELSKFARENRKVLKPAEQWLNGDEFDDLGKAWDAAINELPPHWRKLVFIAMAGF